MNGQIRQRDQEIVEKEGKDIREGKGNNAFVTRYAPAPSAIYMLCYASHAFAILNPKEKREREIERNAPSFGLSRSLKVKKKKQRQIEKVGGI